MTPLSTKVTIALGQMDIALGDPAQNLAQVERFAEEAAAAGATLMLLPELWSTGYDLAHAGRHAQPLDGGIFAATAALAQTHQLSICGSCLSDLGDGRYGNTAVLFDPQGRLLGSYTKAHLFGLMQEDHFLTPGNELGILPEISWGTTGLAICYDLRFPELFRAYAQAGVRLILLPAEWPTVRIAHWRTLLRARAIENQCFVAACNRVGHDSANAFGGFSAIIDPWGETVLEMGAEAGLTIAHIDVAQVAAVRAQIPVMSDRRPDLYG